MAKSFSYDSVDMSAYGLQVKTHNLDSLNRQTEGYQLKDRAVGGTTIHPSKEIVLDVVIEAADYATLCSYLDSIKAAIALETDAALEVDSKTDRYWMARHGALDHLDNGPTYWVGTITFTAFDPHAYDNTETTANHTIDEDPETFNEVVAGTAPAYPVYTLTADDAASVVTVTNSTTGEALVITIALVSTDILVIDTAAMTVKLNGTEDMTGVSGPFPTLIPGTNAFTVAGFSGAMATVYRKRYR